MTSLYCVISDDKTFFKIGISDDVRGRVKSLNHGGTMVSMFAHVDFRGDEDLTIESGKGNCYDLRLSDMDIVSNSSKRTALRWERFFKKKFHQNRYRGKEWFAYSEDAIRYVDRIFRKIPNSENNSVFVK